MRARVRARLLLAVDTLQLRALGVLPRGPVPRAPGPARPRGGPRPLRLCLAQRRLPLLRPAHPGARAPRLGRVGHTLAGNAAAHPGRHRPGPPLGGPRGGRTVLLAAARALPAVRRRRTAAAPQPLARGAGRGPGRGLRPAVAPAVLGRGGDGPAAHRQRRHRALLQLLGLGDKAPPPAVPQARQRLGGARAPAAVRAAGHGAARRRAAARRVLRRPRRGRRLLGLARHRRGVGNRPLRRRHGVLAPGLPAPPLVRLALEVLRELQRVRPRGLQVLRVLDLQRQLLDGGVLRRPQGLELYPLPLDDLVPQPYLLHEGDDAHVALPYHVRAHQRVLLQLHVLQLQEVHPELQLEQALAVGRLDHLRELLLLLRGHGVRLGYARREGLLELRVLVHVRPEALSLHLRQAHLLGSLHRRHPWVLLLPALHEALQPRRLVAVVRLQLLEVQQRPPELQPVLEARHEVVPEPLQSLSLLPVPRPQPLSRALLRLGQRLLQRADLQPQVGYDLRVLSNVVRHAADVLRYAQLDVLGPVRVLERVHRLLQVPLRGAGGRDHGRAAVPAQAVLQQPGELRVAEGDVRAPVRLVPEGVDAVAQGEQRAVDVGALDHPLAHVLRLRRALGPGEVDEAQLAHPHGCHYVRRLLLLLHRHLQHRVRPAAVHVRARRLLRPVPVAPPQELHHLPVAPRLHLLYPSHAHSLHGVLPEVEEGVAGRQQVPYVLVVYLQVAEADPVVVVAECRVVLQPLEHVLQREDHDAGVVRGPDHGVRLPRARGAVREHRGIVPVQDAVDEELGGELVDLLLAHLLVEGVVEGVLAVPHAVAAQDVVLVVEGVGDDDKLAVHHLHLGDCTGGLLLAGQGADADGDQDLRLAAAGDAGDRGLGGLLALAGGHAGVRHGSSSGGPPPRGAGLLRL
mmetsp:Transcript_9043/g.31488  ORF Transcript_9043/g.31488 Transcript_9043/m.31488 type:complete len:910 (-) Transcript_9043:118-2847(-)